MTGDMLRQLAEIKGVGPEEEQRLGLQDYPAFPNEDNAFTKVF
jgi:hypothetical protein